VDIGAEDGVSVPMESSFCDRGPLQWPLHIGRSESKEEPGRSDLPEISNCIGLQPALG
jgi:hypothetical protein